MINWISVTEQLPPTFKVVLIYSPGMDGFMDFGYLYNFGGTKPQWRYLRESGNTDRVTHWAFTNEPE